MDTVNIHEAKTHLSRLVEEVAEGAEIVIGQERRAACKARKASLRRAEFRVDVGKLIDGAHASRLTLLAFEPDHAVGVARLPKHHGDPFDRALIAQAQAEQLVLLTHDRRLASYGAAVRVV